VFRARLVRTRPAEWRWAPSGTRRGFRALCPGNVGRAVRWRGPRASTGAAVISRHEGVADAVEPHRVAGLDGLRGGAGASVDLARPAAEAEARCRHTRRHQRPWGRAVSKRKRLWVGRSHFNPPFVNDGFCVLDDASAITQSAQSPTKIAIIHGRFPASES
jgi:hypothetical protein